MHDHVGGTAGGGGGVRLMLELGCELLERGHGVTVLCHDYLPGSEFDDMASRLDIRAVRTGVSEPPGASARAFAERYLKGMRKVAALLPADTEIVNSHESPGLAGGAVAARRARVPHVWVRNDETFFERASVPDLAIVSDHRLHWRALRAAFGLPERRDARAADAIVVLTRLQAEMVARSYARPAHVVGLGPGEWFFEPVDRAAARAALGVGDDEFLAVTTSILYPHRRFEDFVEAIAQVDDRPALRGLILGSDKGDPAYADHLERLIDERGVRDRLRLDRRSVPDDELRAVYAAADVFVYPNQRQTWGLAPLEALACGTPVILSRGAGVHELLGGRPGVLSVEPERPDLIAGALREAVDGDLRARVGGTRDWLLREVTPSRYAERMEEIFEETLARRGTGP